MQQLQRHKQQQKLFGISRPEMMQQEHFDSSRSGTKQQHKPFGSSRLGMMQHQQQLGSSKRGTKQQHTQFGKSERETMQQQHQKPVGNGRPEMKPQQQ